VPIATTLVFLPALLPALRMMLQVTAAHIADRIPMEFLPLDLQRIDPIRNTNAEAFSLLSRLVDGKDTIPSQHYVFEVIKEIVQERSKR
jgi:hypothetical protein